MPGRYLSYIAAGSGRYFGHMHLPEYEPVLQTAGPPSGNFSLSKMLVQIFTGTVLLVQE